MKLWASKHRHPQVDPTRRHRLRSGLGALLLFALLLPGLALARAQPQQIFFGYSRVALPLVVQPGT